MTLVEHLNIKRLNLFLRLAVLIFLCSLLFAGGLYLTKMRKAIKNDITVLENARNKIGRIIQLEMILKNISLPKSSHHYALEMARLADTIRSKFPETKFELQDPSIDGKEAVSGFTAKGEGDFKKFSEIVGYLESEGYPVIFLKKLSLREKGRAIEYEISGEIRSVI